MYPKMCSKYTRRMGLSALALAMTLCCGFPQALPLGRPEKSSGQSPTTRALFCPELPFWLQTKGPMSPGLR